MTRKFKVLFACGEIPSENFRVTLSGEAKGEFRFGRSLNLPGVFRIRDCRFCQLSFQLLAADFR
jgi:hypothetical protein